MFPITSTNCRCKSSCPLPTKTAEMSNSIITRYWWGSGRPSRIMGPNRPTRNLYSETAASTTSRLVATTYCPTCLNLSIWRSWTCPRWGCDRWGICPILTSSSPLISPWITWSTAKLSTSSNSGLSSCCILLKIISNCRRLLWVWRIYPNWASSTWAAIQCSMTDRRCSTSCPTSKLWTGTQPRARISRRRGISTTHNQNQTKINKNKNRNKNRKRNSKNKCTRTQTRTTTTTRNRSRKKWKNRRNQILCMIRTWRTTKRNFPGEKACPTNKRWPSIHRVNS